MMSRRVLRRASMLSALAFAVFTLACQFVAEGDALALRGGRGGRGGGGGGGFAARGSRPTQRPSSATRPGGGREGTAARPERGFRPDQQPSPATRPGSDNGIRGGSTSISGDRNANRDRNANVDRNIDRDIDRDVDVDVDGRWGWGDDWHYPAGAVVGTAIAVGAVVASIPPTCQPVVINGTTYQSCNGILYQPVYQGTTVQYKVVKVP